MELNSILIREISLILVFFNRYQFFESNFDIFFKKVLNVALSKDKVCL